MTTMEHRPTAKDGGVGAAARSRSWGWSSRLPQWLRVLLGTLVVLAGVAMLVLPGPGLLGILVGLKMLAHDIPAAARAEHAVSGRIKAGARKAGARSRHRRRR